MEKVKIKEKLNLPNPIEIWPGDGFFVLKLLHGCFN